MSKQKKETTVEPVRNYGEIRRATVVMNRWMEIIGLLLHLEERDDELLAEIGTLVVAFPGELKEALCPHLGCRIAVLHTDIPSKEYLARACSENKMQDLCENEQASNCCEMI